MRIIACRHTLASTRLGWQDLVYIYMHIKAFEYDRQSMAVVLWQKPCRCMCNHVCRRRQQLCIYQFCVQHSSCFMHLSSVMLWHCICLVLILQLCYCTPYIILTLVICTYFHSHTDSQCRILNTKSCMLGEAFSVIQMQGSKIMRATSQKLANPTDQIAGNLRYTLYITYITLTQYCPFTPLLLSILRTGSLSLFWCLPLSIMA